MGCLTVTYQRLGGVVAIAERVRGVSCTATRVGGISATATRIGGMTAKAKKMGGMTCRFSLICTTGLVPPYLEINPEIIWVYPDWSAQNEVLSNTRWNVN